MKRSKVCVFTGTAGDRELGFLSQHAREGCNIAFMDINKEAGLKLKKEVEENYGVSVFFFHGDTQSEEDRDLFMGAVEGLYGGIDYWIFNAQ